MCVSISGTSANIDKNTVWEVGCSFVHFGKLLMVLEAI